MLVLKAVSFTELWSWHYNNLLHWFILYTKISHTHTQEQEQLITRGLVTMGDVCVFNWNWTGAKLA